MWLRHYHHGGLLGNRGASHRCHGTTSGLPVSCYRNHVSSRCCQTIYQCKFCLKELGLWVPGAKYHIQVEPH